MRWLWGYVDRHRFAAAASILSGFLGGLTSAAEPFLIGVIIDHVQKGFRPDEMIGDIALLIGLAIVTVIAFYGQRRYSGDVAYFVNFDIRRDIFDHLLTMEQGFYQHYATGDLISRMYSDIDTIWRLLALTFNRFGSAFVSVIVTFVLLASINLPLTLAVFVVLAVSTELPNSRRVGARALSSRMFRIKWASCRRWCRTLPAASRRSRPSGANRA